MGAVSTVRDAWRKNIPELAALWNGALPQFVTARNARDALGGVPVFSYHLVREASFEADLSFLQANGYQTLSSTEFLGFLDGTSAVSERSVLLTFDDGPANFHAVAYPLLKRFTAKAIAFIAPGLHVDVEDVSLEARPMSWAELREIQASGLVEFQSHTFESCYAPEWPLAVPLAGCEPDIENQRRRAVPLPFTDDLALSRQTIERQLPGSHVNQLAFPRYVGTDAAVAAARSLGFRACYWGLTPGRPINFSGDSPFHISRVNDEFLRRLPGSGRISVGAMIGERLRRVRAARQWRQAHAQHS